MFFVRPKRSPFDFVEINYQPNRSAASFVKNER
jgi:hypothetical protein